MNSIISNSQMLIYIYYIYKCNIKMIFCTIQMYSRIDDKDDLYTNIIIIYAV